MGKRMFNPVLDLMPKQPARSARNAILSAMVLLVFVSSAGVCFGQPASYQPLGQWSPPEVEAERRLARLVKNQIDFPGSEFSKADSPNKLQIHGLRPRSIQLLRDTLLRKNSGTLQSGQEARSYIQNQYITADGLQALHQAMHEAMFLETNPDWSPNRKQGLGADAGSTVARKIPGRSSLFKGLLGFHADGMPARYAADLKNARFKNAGLAHRFFIPDDHVQPLKVYLLQKIATAEAAGKSRNKQLIERYRRDHGRIEGAGYGSQAIVGATREAARFAARGSGSPYVSLGADASISLAQITWDWASGQNLTNEFLYQSTRAMSLLGVRYGTEVALTLLAEGALNGTLQGNVVVGVVMFATETVWLLYEHGWTDALSKPIFYESLGGGVGAVAFGIAGFTAGSAAFVWTGPLAPVFGAVAGSVTWTIGYAGGRYVTHTLIDMLAPELIQKHETERLESLQASLSKRIEQLQVWPAR